MNSKHHRRALLAAALAASLIATLGSFTSEATAQTYPTKSITMIVPFGVGGGSDLTARTVGEALGNALGQKIVVDARPGANGALGSAVVARAAPDGYTLLFTAQSSYSLNPNLMKDPLFDQLKDLTPIGTVSRSPWLIAVPADSPFKSIADIVAYGKANPGKLAFPFWQSSVLVTGSLFGRLAGIEMIRVPYKGQVEAQTDLLAGRLPMMVTDVPGARPHVEAGKMRVLASTTAQRSTAYPDMPTMRELGYDIVTDSMLGIFAPAGTPEPILDKLNKELVNVIKNSQSVKDRLAYFGMDPTTMTRQEYDAFVRSELTRWGKLIADAGLQKE